MSQIETPAAEPTADASGQSVADVLAPLVEALLGNELRVRFEFWDGSGFGSTDPVGTIRMTSPDALRRILWRPDELGLGRAFVAGDVEAEGDMFDFVLAFRDAKPKTVTPKRELARLAFAAARSLKLIRPPVKPPEIEAKLGGWRHSLGRDRKAITHHYDVGNDFYRLVLGPSMTYSCARFVDDDATLEDAQAAKYELICRKLGLHERPGATLLDVGCGWGSMAIHAALHHGATVVGVTISDAQAVRARERVAEAGVADRVAIRIQDYRTLTGETFDAISSIGMSEHVGGANLQKYFDVLAALLKPKGRLLNHAITSIGGSKITPASFMGRYVFPDSELIDVGNIVLGMEKAGFEIRDVESLREHYAKTLRVWVDNLESQWDRAVELVGLPRAKVWRLYMAGCAIAFDDGGLGLHQVLGVRPDSDGVSAMPLTRRSLD